MDIILRFKYIRWGGKRLLEDAVRNERMFLVTAFLNTAPTKQELENVVFQTAGITEI